MNVVLENSDETFIPLGTSPPSEGLGEASPPLKVPCHGDNGIESIESCGERNSFIKVESCQFDVDDNPYPPLFDVFLCQCPQSDEAERITEAV